MTTMPTDRTYLPPFLADVETQECANFLLTLKNPCVIGKREVHLLGKTTVPESPSASQGPTMEQKTQETYDSEDSKDPSLLDEQSPFTPTALEYSSIRSLLGESQLVKPRDHRLVPDSIFIAMAQMKVCYLTDADKVGSYKNRKNGFSGLCCRHCGMRRSFPNTLRCLAQTTTSQTIVKHVSSKCQYTPQEVCDTVRDLQLVEAMESDVYEGNSQGRRRYGSRKVFFQRIWNRLHPETAESAEATSSEGGSLKANAEYDMAGALMDSAKRKSRFGSLPTMQNRKRQKPTAV